MTDRLKRAVAVSGSYAALMVLLLAGSASRFDWTEILAGGAFWLLCFGAELVRQSAPPTAYPVRVSAGVLLASLTLAGILGYSAWRIGRKAEELAAPQLERAVVSSYTDSAGVLHELRCGRNPGEPADEQVQRLYALLAYMEARFPAEHSR